VKRDEEPGCPWSCRCGLAFAADPLPPDLTYRPLPAPASKVRAMDEAQKPAVMQLQHALLETRYDLADRPLQGFAAETLPAVLKHLARARGIVEELSLQEIAATPSASGSE
jgi:hypothetical protein